MHTSDSLLTYDQKLLNLIFYKCMFFEIDSYYSIYEKQILLIPFNEATTYTAENFVESCLLGKFSRWVFNHRILNMLCASYGYQLDNLYLSEK